jgi:hypothetical protein
MNLTRSLTVLSAAVLAGQTLAGSITYAGRRTEIRAGVVIVNEGGTAAAERSSRPHVWTQLDRDRAIKPAEWTFLNPLAESLVTSSIATRWGVAEGSRLTKQDAPYWEVDLNKTSRQALTKMDVLFLGAGVNTILTPGDREKLRNFVDEGGLLWVDYIGDPAPFGLESFPISVDTFNSGANLSLDPFNPLLSRPNTLNVGELAELFVNKPGAGTRMLGPLNNGQVIDLWNQPTGPDSLRFNAVIGSDPSTYVTAVAKSGEGYFLATSRDVSVSLGQGTNTATNPPTFSQNIGYRSLPISSNAKDFNAAAKLMVNAISLRSNYESFLGGPRNTSTSGVDLPAPLIKRFLTRDFTPKVGTNPVIFGGVIFMTTPNDTIVALDSDPANDIDGNGNPDDGFDDPDGSPVDLLWESEQEPEMSSPTAFEGVRRATNIQASGEIAVQIRAAGGATRVLFYPADFREVANPQIAVPHRSEVASPIVSGTAVISPNLSTGERPPAPITVHEGIGFVGDVDQAGSGQRGRIWMIDLANKSLITSTANGQWWRLGNAPRLGLIDGPLTVGYVPIADNSGGQDRVIYAPFMPDGVRQAGFASIWLGSRSEAPYTVTQSGSTLTIITRAALQNLNIYNATGGIGSLGTRVTVVDTNTGQPIPNAVTGLTINNGGNPGQIQASISGGGLIFTGPTQNASVRVDYSIDYGFAPTNPESFIRGDVQFPDKVGGSRRILGGIALTKNGTAFATVAPDEANQFGGSVFCLKENGRGDFQMIYRWEAYDRFAWPNAISAGSTFGGQFYDGAVIDYDGVLDFAFIGNLLDKGMIKQTIASAPVVKGDTVYVGMRAAKQLFPGFEGTTSAVLAFDAEPSVRTVTLENLSVNSDILQPDPGKSTAILPNVDQYNTIRNGQYTYDPVGTDGAGTLSFPNVATVNRSKMRDALICNLPFVLRRVGSPDVIVSPDATAADAGRFVPGNAQGRFNPLKWSMVINGFDLRSNLFAAGDVLYFGGQSVLPSIIEGNFPPTNSGFTYAVNTRISSTDIRLPGLPRIHMGNLIGRKWEPYVSTIDVGTNPGDVVPSPYILWPNPFGIRSFDDLRVRFRASTLGAGEIVQRVVGGNGVLNLTTDRQNITYARADLLVGDAGRILRVDPSGQPVWALDSTIKAGREGSVNSTGNEVRLSNPTRVIPVSATDYWIVDSGDKRIVKVDATGREIRTINRFMFDPVFTPEGVSRNADPRLGVPRDLVTFNTFKSTAEINNLVSRNQLAPAIGRNFSGSAEYWNHYVIADSGTQRIIELVDRYEYNPTTGFIGNVIRVQETLREEELSSVGNTAQELVPALGVLRWQIRSDLTGKQFAYNSIDRVFQTTGTTTAPLYVFGYGNREASPESLGLPTTNPNPDNAIGGGGVIIYDGNRGPTASITEFVYQNNIPANVFWDDASGTFNSAPVTAANIQPQRISGLRSATISYLPVAGGGFELGVMIADNNGVYELVLRGTTWVVNWMMDQRMFRVMRRTGNAPIQITAKNPLGFKPMYAKRLSSGEILLVNGYVGEHRTASLGAIPTFGIDPGDQYGGEVVILSGDTFSWTDQNLGLNSYGVQYELPPLSGTRELVSPVFGLKR